MEIKNFTNKRIDLDDETLSILELMTFLYRKEANAAGITKDAEMLSFMVRKAIMSADPKSLIDLPIEDQLKIKKMSPFYEEEAIKADLSSDIQKRTYVVSKALQHFYEDDFKKKI